MQAADAYRLGGAPVFGGAGASNSDSCALLHSHGFFANTPSHRLQDARADPSGPAAAAFRDVLARRLKGSAGDAAKATPPRKFILDLQAAEEGGEESAAVPEVEAGQPTPKFLMARGMSSGTGRTRAAATLEESAAAAAQTALDELLGIEMARLTKLAMTVK